MSDMGGGITNAAETVGGGITYAATEVGGFVKGFFTGSLFTGGGDEDKDKSS